MCPMIQKAKTQNIRVCSKERFIDQEGIDQEDGSLNGASNPSCSLDQDKVFKGRWDQVCKSAGGKVLIGGP